MVKGRTNPICDSDGGGFEFDDEFDDAVISHQKAKSYNAPRAQTGILSKTDRKRATDKKLESAARGMSRVGKGKPSNLWSRYLLQKERLMISLRQSPKHHCKKRDKPKDRNLTNQPDVGRNKQDRDDDLSADRTAKRNNKLLLNRAKSDNRAKAEAKREEAHQKQVQRSRAAKNNQSNEPDSDSEYETYTFYRENPSIDNKIDEEERRQYDKFTPTNHGRVYRGDEDTVMSDVPANVYMQPPANVCAQPPPRYTPNVQPT